MRVNTNMRPQTISAGTVTSLQQDKGRAYLAVVATADTLITFTDDAVGFTLLAGHVWAPIPSPINALTFSGEGTLITG